MGFQEGGMLWNQRYLCLCYWSWLGGRGWNITMRLHVYFKSTFCIPSVSLSHFETCCLFNVTTYQSSRGMQDFFFLGFIGLKRMIIRPVIGIYIQAHYPVSFGKYLTSSKQRKISFSLCYVLVCFISYVTCLAIKYTIFPVPWSSKTKVIFTWICGLVD